MDITIQQLADLSLTEHDGYEVSFRVNRHYIEITVDQVKKAYDPETGERVSDILFATIERKTGELYMDTGTREQAVALIEKWLKEVEQ